MKKRTSFYRRTTRKLARAWRGAKRFLRRRDNALALLVLLVVITVSAFLSFVYAAPREFPDDGIVTVKQGQSLAEVADHLEQEDVVRSSLLFRGVVTILDGDTGVQAGDYLFERPVSVYEVARRITHGIHNLERRSVTIPEGANVVEVSQILEDTLPQFDEREFLRLAQPNEGYLFPDTYHFLPDAEPESVVEVMEHTFWKRVDPLTEEINRFARPTRDVITMASLIEEEASDPEERRVIAGILWNRIEAGMPLQVDATFSYINGKNTYELTLQDLATSSPYNTYQHKGLPPGPIANPGLDAIEATINPAETDYFFYLHGAEGNIHYAQTAEGHQRNKRTYME